jgi:hypothetical protein
MNGLVFYSFFLNTGIQILNNGLIHPAIYLGGIFSPALGWMLLPLSVPLALIGIFIELNINSAWSFEVCDYEQSL